MMNEGFELENNVQEMTARYHRSRALDSSQFEYAPRLTAKISPNWNNDGRSFWYARTTDQGVEYRVVDAIDRSNELAFDHLALANALSAKTGKQFCEHDLPLANLTFSEDELFFEAEGNSWVFNGELSPSKRRKRLPSHWLISPDGGKAVYLQGGNLWLRDINAGEDQPLTTDGETHYAYGVAPEAQDLVGNLTDSYDEDPLAQTPLARPEAAWSPDGRYIYTYQLDERQVAEIPSVLFAPQDYSLRPRMAECRYALPGDKHVPTYRFVILDTETGKETRVAYPNVEHSFVWFGAFSGNRAWWSGDARRAYFLDMERGQKSVRVVEITANTGETRVLFKECADTFLEIGHGCESPTDIVPVPETDELIWFSQRSGHAHYYLYDLKSGKLKNAITTGDWSVHKTLYYNVEKRELFFTLMGRDLERNYYYREVARVQIDSGELAIVASSDHDYDAAGGISPCGAYLVSTHSRVDTPATTELRDRDGNILLTLEKSDLSLLPEAWNWPEPIQTTAADGKTQIYGVLFKPSDFDPNRKYAVLDFGQSNPFSAGAPQQAFGFYYGAAAAFAELGMIVVMMNGRGTSFRDKKFRDYGWNEFLENGGIVDRAAGIKELAAERPYMDLGRVGIVDFDGSNAGVIGLLKFPEFYRVGVAGSIYDPRLVKQGEVYMGLTTEKKRSTAKVWGDEIKGLKGKLLIQTGLRDRYFHPGCTFFLTDALIKANKDFEHLVQPNGAHAWRLVNARRRVWDFLVTHLIGGTPPANFELVSAIEQIAPGQMTEHSRTVVAPEQ